MQVLAQGHELTFVNRGEWDEETHQYSGGGGDKIRLSPKPKLQSLPDWVRHDNTFKMAVKTGLIVEMNPVAPIEIAEAAPEPAKPAPAIGLSGSGAFKPPMKKSTN